VLYRHNLEAVNGARGSGQTLPIDKCRGHASAGDAGGPVGGLGAAQPCYLVDRV